MQKKNISDSGLQIMALLACAAVATLTTESLAYPQGADPHSQLLGGPYELLVQRGMQGSGMVYPVEIENQNAPGKLNAVFPVMGSSVKIKLDEFVPELIWEQYTEKSEQGGSVVKLRAVGPGLDQEIWLCAEDAEKQSISSSIGGIGVKKVPGKDDLVKTAARLADPNAVGILAVWRKNSEIPTVYVVSGGSEIQIEESSYKFKVLEYMPHYSVDTETNAIVNASPEPKNPAIRVQFTEGGTPVEQWLFTRFKTHPHVPNKIPLRVEFTDFDLGTQPGNYTVLVSPQGQPQILFRRDQGKQAEAVKLNTPYPLAQEGYNFIIDEIFSDVVLKQRWKNNRNQLLNPAVIATVDRDGQTQQVVLELNKPQHIRSESETMVLLLRRKTETPKHLE